MTYRLPYLGLAVAGLAVAGLAVAGLAVAGLALMVGMPARGIAAPGPVIAPADNAELVQ